MIETNIEVSKDLEKALQALQTREWSAGVSLSVNMMGRLVLPVVSAKYFAKIPCEPCKRCMI